MLEFTRKKKETVTEKKKLPCQFACGDDSKFDVFKENYYFL